MERRIAVFANAWGEKCLSDSLESIKKCATEYGYDIFVFAGHAAPGMNEDEKREEKRIYNLPELEDFNGAIIFSDSMNFIDLVYSIRDKAKKAGVPIVNIGNKIEGMVSVSNSDLDSMLNLVEHLVVEHEVRKIAFIAGPKGTECSDLRIEATRRTFAKYSIPFKEEWIYYGDWSIQGAVDFTKAIMAKEDLPDAIICANDIIAMSVCVELENMGLRVPDDVIVTGYDNHEKGQIFNPSLCTVGQDYYRFGEIAFELLMKLVRGEEALDVVLTGDFISNQSCGCENPNINELRAKVCKDLFFNDIKTKEFGWANDWISEVILSKETSEQMKEGLETHFINSTMFTNRTAYILEDVKAKMYFEGEQMLEHSEGYSDDLDVLVAVEEGQVVDVKKINRRELIPAYKKVDGKTKLYIFVPVHFRDWVFGYAVVEDWLIGIATGRVKVFCDNFNATINKRKQNIALEHLNNKLTELYTKDSLTGIYNRFGFNTEGKKIFNDSLRNRKHMVLMFIDINRMKLINDYYGHLQGDIAIKTVSEVIVENIMDNWIAIRFGGDEFLVVGQSDNEEDIVTAKENIVTKVKTLGVEMKFPFYLSVSCGYLYFCPEEGASLDRYIKEVDEAMYEIKVCMHSSDRELRAFEEKCKKN